MKVCIDPGHGGYDSGAVGYSLKEKELTLKIALYLRDYLEKYGCEVIMTRDSDGVIWNKANDLQKRCDIANNAKVDYFISIHINAGGGTGYETWIANNASQKSIELAQKMHMYIAEFYKGNGFVDRGLKSGRLWVLRRTNMPAILIENLFIDNEKDAKFLSNDDNLKNIAKAIANAFVNVFNLNPKGGNIMSTPQVPFRDIDNHWAEKVIARAYQMGLLAKSDKFRPNDPITRAEVVALIDRAINYIMNATKNTK